MHIGLDARPLTKYNGGIGRYTENLIDGLTKISNKIDFTLFTNKCIHKELPANFKLSELEFKLIFESKIHTWELITLPIALKKEKIDIYHSTGFLGPIIFKPCKMIMTLHDLTFRLFPENLTFDAKMYWNNLITHNAEKSDLVITISESSKRDISAILKIPEDRIRVIPQGIDHNHFKVLGDNTDIRDKYSLPKSYILFVGTIEPRKNINELIISFNYLKKNKHIKHKLIIAGNKGWLYEDVFKLVYQLGLREEVIFLNFVQDSDLPYIYNSADIFIYPSFYEGFGLPPLEAMTCGTPVITSNTSSLPEVVGNAGIMVDPHDVDGLAKAIYEVLTNEGLREDMIKKGLERAKLFSWEKTARETIKVYEEVYNGSKR